MIAARIDDHIGALGHVAVGAEGAGRAGLVMRMGGDIELRRLMALQADPVAGRPQARAVRLVAIGAGDAGMVHPALQERAVFIDLVADLAVGEIESGVEQRNVVDVADRRRRGGIGPDLGAARMAAGTDLDLVGGGPRRRTGAVAGRRVELPGDAAALVEPDRQAVVAGRRTRFRPGEVARAGAVTGLA